MQLEKKTVWVRQEEIVQLFGKERSVITRHINNIFKDKEVDKKGNVQFLHIAGSDKAAKDFAELSIDINYK